MWRHRAKRSQSLRPGPAGRRRLRRSLLQLLTIQVHAVLPDFVVGLHSQVMLLKIMTVYPDSHPDSLMPSLKFFLQVSMWMRTRQGSRQRMSLGLARSLQ